MEAGATCNRWVHLKNPGARIIYFEHNTRLQYTQIIINNFENQYGILKIIIKHFHLAWDQDAQSEDLKQFSQRF